MMKNATLSSQHPATQGLAELAELAELIKDLEQPLIDFIGMSDILHDGLLFRADHPTDKKASSYDGAVHLAGEIHSRLMHLYDEITNSAAYEQPAISGAFLSG